MSQLVTGEAVTLDLRPAALPSRLLAGLVDVAVQFTLLAVVGGVATAVSLEASPARAAALGLLVLILVLIVYPVTFETLLRGRTPGKAALGLRVVRDDGGPIGFRQALVRGLAGAFLERPGITLFLGAVVSMLLNDSSKRLGDLLAGTIVVRERLRATGGAVATMPPQLEGWAASLDLSRLPDSLALSARQFVSRADQLTEEAREDLGGRLVRAVIDAVGPPPPGTPGWAVLSAVLAERRRREHQRLTARPGTAPGRSSTSAPPTPAPPTPAPLTPAPRPPAPGTPTSAPAPAPAVPADGTDRPGSSAAGPGGFVAPG